MAARKKAKKKTVARKKAAKKSVVRKARKKAAPPKKKKKTAPARKAAKKKVPVRKPARKKVVRTVTEPLRVSSLKPVSLDASALHAAFPSLSSLVSNVDDVLPDLGVNLKELEARLSSLAGPVGLDRVLPPRELEGYFHHTWGGHALVVGMLLSHAGIDRHDEQIAGDLHIAPSQVHVVTGNLSVTGRLTVEGNLVVLGRATVHELKDSIGAQTVVVGNLSVEGFLHSQGFLGVGGNVKARLVFLDFNQGFAKILGGLQARVLVENDHGGSVIHGPLQADYAVTDELLVQGQVPEQGGLPALTRQLAPEAAVLVEKHVDERTLGTFLVGRMEAGLSVFKDSVG